MIRFVGAALLVAGCSGFGFCIAAAHRREAAMLRRLIRALQEMEWELKYRMTELPELCAVAADAAGGRLKDIFLQLQKRLDGREVVHISGCLNGILNETELPRAVRRNMKQLGASLGRYDLEGQLQGLTAVRCQCRHDLKALENGSADRLKSYQTLAVCTGTALAILFL